MNAILTLFLIAASASPPPACSFYAARDYPGIKLEEREREIIVAYDAFNDTFQKVIVKPFGALIEGGVKEGEMNPHPFSRTKIDGKDAIIFDSIVFFPDCP